MTKGPMAPLSFLCRVLLFEFFDGLFGGDDDGQDAAGTLGSVHIHLDTFQGKRRDLLEIV